LLRGKTKPVGGVNLSRQKFITGSTFDSAEEYFRAESEFSFLGSKLGWLGDDGIPGLGDFSFLWSTRRPEENP